MITRELLRQWRACYSDERIAALVPPEGLTPLQVLGLDIPAADRLWVVLREEVIPARQLREFACDIVEEACRKNGVTNARSYAAIETARRFARGEATADELASARGAARGAACAATIDAARSAAIDAVMYAERDRQVERVRAILTEIARGDG
jgi:hypothetical protein